MSVTLIEVLYAGGLAPVQVETPYLWDEVRTRLIGASPSPWLTIRSPASLEIGLGHGPEALLNLNHTLRVQLLTERKEEQW